MIGRYWLFLTRKYAFVSLVLAPQATRIAVEKARDVFLRDSLDFYKRKNASWHKTTCFVKGAAVTCLVLPPGTPLNNLEDQSIGLMFESFDRSKDLSKYCTHDIELNDGRECNRARLKVSCGYNGELLDPFDLELVNGK